MKKLTLIRHAKSSWKYPALADYDRPLNKRGRKDAPMMAKRLAKRGFAPQRILSSTALRALRTAEVIAGVIDLPFRAIEVDPLIYGADDHHLLERIRNFAFEDEWVAIVGHNPEMTLLTRRLSGERLNNLPTCGIAEMHFESDQWQGLGRRETTPSFFNVDYPKNTHV
jgi:phosphohistidine phosphatase